VAGDSFFWTFFGSVWLIVGLGAALVSASSLLTGVPEPSSPDLRWVFLIAGTAMTGFGGTIVVRARREAARLRRLMAAGIEIAATVTEIRPSAITVNRRRQWHVHYRYEHGVGGPYAGASGALPEEAIADLAVGATVRIKVDPARPVASVLLPRA
jgi:hypothetical protein